MVHCVSSSNAEPEPNDGDWNVTEKDKPHSSSVTSPSTCGPDSYSCDTKSIGTDVFVESSSNVRMSPTQHHPQQQIQHVMYTYGDMGPNRNSLKRKHSIGDDHYAGVGHPKSLSQLSHHHNQQLRKTDDVGSGKYYPHS